MRTLISGGTVVTADGSYRADVLVDGERIALVGADLTAGAGAGIAPDETIDASGKYVIPGGIDVHTHMKLPFGGTFAKDDFFTGTRAAAFGGTTTIVDFAVQSKGKSLREGLDAWHALAEGKAVIDYGFHMIMSDVTDESLREMDQLVAEGIPDFKLFTAYPGVFYSDDAQIFRAMQQTGQNGGLIMMHAENGPAIDIVAAQLVAQGKTDPYYHGVARYPVFEGEATNRVIRLAEAAHVPVYIVHLSVIDALSAVREARDRGAQAFAETCPQYLFLSLEDLGHGFEGAKFVCSPPLREQDPNWTELWRGLIRDDLQLVSTDHCPFDFEGQKDLGKGDFRKIPNGLPGVEDRLDLLHDGGVVGGHISKERWVEIVSTSPAKLFGMYPRKGAIAAGSDADLVVYDPKRKHTISAKTHHMDVDYSCYEGRVVQGGSDVVLSRGSVVIRDGAFTGRAGAGRFLKRAAADYARAS
jgi:dihydropyrimidinase